MAQNKEAELHRRNIQRYRYLLDSIRDPEIGRILEQLLKEAQERIVEIERDGRS
jgi:hypothetical protein